MISAHLIKARLIELYGARPGASQVALVYGVPKSADEVAGDDPLLRMAIGFEDPIGEFLISEMCGPNEVTYDEDYTMQIVLQCIGANTDATFYDVEQRIASMLFQVTRILQDPQLGLLEGTTLDERFSRVRVTLSDFEATAGWQQAGKTRLAAGRAMVELHIESTLKGAIA